MTVATEEGLNMSRRRPRRQQPQDWQQRRPQQQHQVHDCRDLHHHHQQQHRSNNRACSDWSGGWAITSQANPSSVTSERFRLQPRRLDPSSRLGAYRTTVTYSCSVIAFRAHASVPRPHEYYQCCTQWTNWQTTQRPIVQLTGDQGPARASSLNSQH